MSWRSSILDHHEHREHEGRNHFFQIQFFLRYLVFVSFAIFVVSFLFLSKMAQFF